MSPRTGVDGAENLAPPPGSEPRTVQPVVSYAFGSFIGMCKSFRIFLEIGRTIRKRFWGNVDRNS